jgi:hypothetical protein
VQIRFAVESWILKNDVPLIIQQLLFETFWEVWHMIILCHNASPIQCINLMAHPLLALKQLREMFKDLAFFIASSQNRS